MSTNAKAATETATPAPPAARRVRLFDLLTGVPALAAAAGLVGVLVFQGAKGSLEAAYLRDVESRSKRNDLHGALIDLKRLTALDPSREDYRLSLALILERMGNLGRAEALARTMTPLDDRKGNPSARLWLVRRLMGDHRGSFERLRDAERHLKHLLRDDPGSPIARLMLGNLYQLTNRPKEARPLFESLPLDSPEMIINLAKVCKAMNDMDEAKRRVDQAVVLAKKQAEAAPDEILPLLYWSNALLVLDDYQGALDVLAKGDRREVKAKFPAPPEGREKGDPVREALATLCVNWADWLSRSGKATPNQLLEVVEKGLAYDPKNGYLLVRLSDLFQTPGVDKERLRGRFQQMEGEKDLAVLAHFALGNESWQKGEAAAAREHWEKALKGEVPMPLAANNLAYALAYTEPKDAARALEVIDKALKDAPKEPRLLGTRGQVLNQLGRWKDAVGDLELALSTGTRSVGLHRALADAYEHLGMAEKSAEHRSLSKPNSPAAPK